MDAKTFAVVYFNESQHYLDEALKRYWPERVTEPLTWAEIGPLRRSAHIQAAGVLLRLLGAETRRSV